MAGMYSEMKKNTVPCHEKNVFIHYPIILSIKNIVAAQRTSHHCIAAIIFILTCVL